MDSNNETARHALVVSYEEQTDEERAEGLDPRLDDYLQVEIECSGPSGLCLTWWECRKPHVILKKGWSLTELIDECSQDVWHGVEHRVIEGMAMVASDPPQCLAHAFDSGQESAFDVAGGMEPGRYRIEVTYEGDEYVHIELSRQPVAS